MASNAKVRMIKIIVGLVSLAAVAGAAGWVYRAKYMTPAVRPGVTTTSGEHHDGTHKEGSGDHKEGGGDHKEGTASQPAPGTASGN